jgi:hypothetical protein
VKRAYDYFRRKPRPGSQSSRATRGRNQANRDGTAELRFGVAAVFRIFSTGQR